jgi:disulfide oxidoreductase YuzD
MCKLYFYVAIMFCSSTFGQQLIPNYEIGRWVDYNKKPINGYYDFDYESQAPINIEHDAIENFTKGYYFDNSGLKVYGLLKYSQADRELKFKLKEEDIEKSLKADETKGYIIGIDTFSVVKNVMVAGFFSGYKLSNKNEFAENIENIAGMLFYKFSAQRENGASYDKFIVKKNETSDFVTFPSSKDKFEKMAADIFGSDPVLLASILKGKYAEKDVPTMIKIFKYRKFYNKSQNILYNSFRDETNNKDEYTFYSKIESVQDSVFHLSHCFKNNIKIYEGDFTSFYPYKKENYLLFYYPNGILRRKISYVDDKPKTEIDYFENGKVHTAFYITDEGINEYKKVYNTENINVLNANGSGEESFLDTITGKMFTYEYEKNRLKRAYFKDSNGEKIYLLCENNAEIKRLKKLQKLATEKLIYPLKSIEQNSHGVVLVKCVIESSGLVSDVQLIKGLDSECDKAVLDFLSCFKAEVYWQEAKVDNVAVKQEIILPIDFSINTSSTYRNNYYNSWFFHNMMFQQQQMMMQQQSMMRPAGFR